MTRPRIRTLKPEIHQSESVGALSDRAFRLYVGLITMADDAGRLRALPAAIIGHVFPWAEPIGASKLRKILDEIEAARLIDSYEVDAKSYLWVKGWREHQKINRPTPSKLPPPPDPEGSWFPHDDLSEEAVSEPGAFTSPVVNGSRSKSCSPARTRVPAARRGSDRDLDQLPPKPPSGGRARQKAEYRERLEAFAAAMFPGAPVSDACRAVEQAVRYGKCDTAGEVIEFVSLADWPTLKAATA